MKEVSSQKPKLIRLAYMLLFALIGRFVSIIVFFTAIFQFSYSYFKGKTNEEALKFTASLALYAKEIITYLAMNSEEKPWPMGEWPKEQEKV